MKNCLSQPGTKARHHQDALLAAYNRHATAGEVPTSGRFLYYELVQAGTVTPHGGRRTVAQDLADALTVLRRLGLVPWEAIVDETRSVTTTAVRSTVAEYVIASAGSARIDAWDGQPPLIVTESRSLAGVLAATVAGPYAVPITATNGMGGRGHLHVEVAPLLAARRTPIVHYFGDFNAAGHDIEASTRRELEVILGTAIDWQRVALTEAMTDGLTPKSVTDRRNGRTASSWECEALGQSTIQRLAMDALDTLRSERGLESIADVRADEDEQRVHVRTVLAGLLGDG